jgi:hypothetical protein
VAASSTRPVMEDGTADCARVSTAHKIEPIARRTAAATRCFMRLESMSSRLSDARVVRVAISTGRSEPKGLAGCIVDADVPRQQQ